MLLYRFKKCWFLNVRFLLNDKSFVWSVTLYSFLMSSLFSIKTPRNMIRIYCKTCILIFLPTFTFGRIFLKLLSFKSLTCPFHLVFLFSSWFTFLISYSLYQHYSKIWYLQYVQILNYFFSTPHLVRAWHWFEDPCCTPTKQFVLL